MTSEELTFNNIRNRSPVSECKSCKDNSVSIVLNDMNEKIVFRPEDLDNNKRSDCAIFFNPSNNTSGRGISLSLDGNSKKRPEYISIVELKSTLNDFEDIKDQIRGGIKFVVDILLEFESPPWNLEWYCLVPHESANIGGYNRRKKKTINVHVGGKKLTFFVITVNNNKSLCDIIDRDINSSCI
jgi:hypothetical protein